VARLAAILAAVGRAVRRDLGTFRQLKTNNFFLFISLLIYSAMQSGVAATSSYPLLLLLFALLLFPLSSDPLEKVPPSRLALWPITRGGRFALRLMSMGLSPVLWFALAMLVLKRRTSLAAPLLTVAIGVQAIAVFVRSAIKPAQSGEMLRLVPPFPGKLGGLIRANLRQMLTVLDVYVAAAFSLGGAAYRFFGAHPDPEAWPILSLMIAMAMSTYAQCLFGLDRSSSAMVRYRLLPLKGWEILIAKDAAYLALLAVLLLPLDPLTGLTSGLVALAVGHHASLRIPIPLRRWRFSGSRVFPGLVGGIGGIMMGFAEHQRGIRFLFAAIAIWGLSTALYGANFPREPGNPRSKSGISRL
jgi:hypothetical protein